MHRCVSLLFLLVFTTSQSVSACTNLLVTKGASTDGSTMITYTCDGVFHPHLRRQAAQDYPAGDSVEILDWYGKSYGFIPQVKHTYAWVGYINEHQLAISETTFGGREELKNPDGMLHYKDLIQLALERAKTAREAVDVMTSLVEKHGYRSLGESISIADKQEIWILEIIGTGPGGKGAVWVAVKVPDGYISAHANKARIGTFSLKDSKNCLYSKNVISFAKKKGYYDKKSKKPFLFNEAYCPTTPKNNRYADTRVWSIFRRAAPSKKLSPDYHRSVEGAKPYPLWIKPDKKISLADVFSLMRDHYEGTDFDMTKGVDAGPYGSPNRWRPLSWTHDSVEYIWERPISTQQTGFSFVSQSRAHLPDGVGGVLWYGLDETYFTCYVPLYCSINELPESFTKGEITKFSWESGWWIFNHVANLANLKYSYMKPEIMAVQREMENHFFALQPAIEKTAKALAKTDPALMAKFLTDYSVTHGERVVKRWRELGEYLMTKYNDGYIRDKDNKVQEKGYPKEWIERVLKERPDQFKLKEQKEKALESELVD